MKTLTHMPAVLAISISPSQQILQHPFMTGHCYKLAGNFDYLEIS